MFEIRSAAICAALSGLSPPSLTPLWAQTTTWTWLNHHLDHRRLSQVVSTNWAPVIYP